MKNYLEGYNQGFHSGRWNYGQLHFLLFAIYPNFYAVNTYYFASGGFCLLGSLFCVEKAGREWKSKMRRGETLNKTCYLGQF